jgi:ubiquinone biosynthesis protein COQ4
MVTPEPFYGLPRSQASKDCETDTASARFALLLRHAATALRDPTRADSVAAVGELTGTLALQRMHQAMKGDPVGRQILKDRPIVSKASIPYERLIDEAKTADLSADTVTFGQAYGIFLKTHDFDPDGRDKVRYVEDEELAYVMLRYRQCHDFWHALTQLPPTVVGELGLKWLELFQTGLPLAAFASTVGSFQLSQQEQQILWIHYLPWAKRIGRQLPYCALMNVYYEREWDTPLNKLRKRLHIEQAPEIPSVDQN